MKLPTKIEQKDISNGLPSEVIILSANKINEVIDFIDYFIRETQRCCTCNGCPRHPKEKSLAQKFQAFREKRGNGSGTDYWEGLEDIANEYYHQL